MFPLYRNSFLFSKGDPMKLNKKITAAIAVIIIAACAGGGWYYYQTQQKAQQASAVETAQVAVLPVGNMDLCCRL